MCRMSIKHTGYRRVKNAPVLVRDKHRIPSRQSPFHSACSPFAAMFVLSSAMPVKETNKVLELAPRRRGNKLSQIKIRLSSINKCISRTHAFGSLATDFIACVAT